MYILRREDQTNPFAVVSHVVNDVLVKQAITEELSAEETTIEDFNKVQSMEWGDTLTLKCEVIDEEGAVYPWEIEITKTVSYI